MFLTLLAVTFMIAVAVCWVVSRMFDKPLEGVLKRIVADEISVAWKRYLGFAVFVVGISSGVRIWELEKYITPSYRSGDQVISLTLDRWVLEVYRTIIGALQGIAWLLLVFFVFALIAYVLVRIFELRRMPRVEG
ncbi:MAG: hypothetical protein AB1898_14725 [Acidobacteriota bacterium]